MVAESYRRTPPGDQAQVDFAQFQLQFTDEPTITRIVWLFSFVLGFIRLTWARFVLHQKGMVSVDGNFYSVPDATRKRIVEVHTLANEVQIFEVGSLIATHPVREGRNQRRVAPGHRNMVRITDPHHDKPVLIVPTGDVVAARPLSFYQAVGRRLACQGDQP